MGAGLGKHRNWKGWGCGIGDRGLKEVGKGLQELGLMSRQFWKRVGKAGSGRGESGQAGLGRRR